MNARRLLLAVLACLPALACAQTLPENGKKAFTEVMATRATLDQLRAGGHVLYIRHGNTDNSRADRFLHDDGRKLMREIGKQLREAKIPVGEILASPMCRTRESATLMFGERFAVSEPLMYSANMTREEKKPRLAALARILRDPVAAGSNRVLIAHAPNLADLIGFFVKPEGTVVIFTQRGDAGYEYVASIPPGLWPQLLR